MMDKRNNEVTKKNFIAFVTKECELNNGGLVLQLIDGIFDLAQPEHLEWVDDLHEYDLKHVTKEEAYDLGFEELSDWSHKEDELIYSEMGVLFNLGNTRPGMFSF